MREGYDVLGNYISLVDERNRELSITNLLGVSIEKRFIPSIANIVGTDLSSYKIVRTGQFAYGPVTSRNGEKISIALLSGEDCIISSSYTVFEIKDKNHLDAEYLMLWFSRPEFDRYARYRSHGSVREIFDWEEMCSVELPVPEISKQKEIVKAYRAITDRIELKRKINDNLAETAQAIFKHLFIDATSEGMPITWAKVPLYEVADLGAGGDRPEAFSDVKTSEFPIPIFSNGIENEGLYGYTDKPKVQAESVTISARGTVGYVFLRQEPFVPIVRLIYITPKDERVTAKYLFFALRYAEMNSTGTSQQQITVPDFKNTPIIVPNADALAEFMCRITPLFDEMNCIKGEIDKLKTLQAVMLQTISSR